VTSLRQSITATFPSNGQGSVRRAGASSRLLVHRHVQNRVVRTLPNPFPLEHREDRE